MLKTLSLGLGCVTLPHDLWVIIWVTFSSGRNIVVSWHYNTFFTPSLRSGMFEGDCLRTSVCACTQQMPFSAFVLLLQGFLCGRGLFCTAATKDLNTM